jgi:hypothetical protein
VHSSPRIHHVDTAGSPLIYNLLRINALRHAREAVGALST